MEVEKQISCQYCHRLVPLRNFEIHSFSCLQKHRMLQDEDKQWEEDSQQEMEFFTCVECMKQVEQSQYDMHYHQCPMAQSQCLFCKQVYPNKLMNDHCQVCQIKNSTQQFQLEERQLIRERQLNRQRQFMREIYRRQNDLRFAARDIQQSLIRNMAIDNSIATGLKQKDIQFLKQSAATKAGQVCCVCYCDIQIKDILFDLNCKHQFHVKCLKPWLEKNSTCPMCRKQVLQFLDD